MTDSLSYPSLRCVLEYLEANRRLHITSRTPSLQNFEKSIPLHLDLLYLVSDSIRINDYSYQLYKKSEKIDYDDTRFKNRPSKKKVTPGDLQFNLEDATWRQKFLEIEIRKYDDLVRNQQIINFEISKKRVPISEKHVAKKALACALLGGRCPIKVKILQFNPWCSKIIRLSEGLKIEPRKIHRAPDDVQTIFPILHAPKNLEIRIFENSEILSHPVVESTENLILVGDRRFIPEWLLTYLKSSYPNPYLRLEDIKFEDLDVLGIVKAWIENQEEKIGKILRISCGDYFYRFLGPIEEELNPKKVSLTERKTKRKHTSYYSIPINTVSELLIYEEYIFSDVHFTMEIVPIGTTIPYVEEKLEAESPKNSELDTRFSDLLIVLAILFMIIAWYFYS